VPPWHIAASEPPGFTIGLGFTIKVLIAVAFPQSPPAVVRVRVMGELTVGATV
jgi:hypothetical protein